MGVSLEIYRAAIGLFNIFKTFFTVNALCICLCITMINLVILFTLFSGLIGLILLSGLVHPNPGLHNVCMSIAHLNARSLNNQDKLSEISLIAWQCNFSLFAFSETWLNSNVSNENISIPGYNILRYDRSITCGGGVALYILYS